MLNKLKIILMSFFLIALIMPTPARASHCRGKVEVLNGFTEATPGATIIVDYEGLDALMYLGFVNKIPDGTSFIAGDLVIVGNHSAYDYVVVMVFHERCYAGFRRVPTHIHYQWNEMIKGPGA